ncbi:MAG: benzoate/H(+) symporter BenE family transporter [Candidatus Eiseniibacteriota bacterium]
MVLEAPSQRLPGFGEFLAALDRHSISNGIAAFLVASTGPLVILLSVSINGGLTNADISSWIFAGYGLSGVISIVFTVLYRMPMGMAWTIPGAVLLSTSLDHLPFAAVVGTYYVTATLILILGLTGWVRRMMDSLPLPIVMGMVAGVFLPIVLKIITAFGDSAIIAGATLAAFLVLSLLPALSRIVTPVLGALVVGAAATVLTGQFHLKEAVAWHIAEPILYRPQFSLQACLELVVPMAMTVIGIHNAQGFAISRVHGYKPPVNTLTVACGVGSYIIGAFGSVSLCVTGPVNGILNTSGRKERRFAGGVVFGILMIVFGLFAPVATQLALALPTAFIGILGGLAMLPVLQGAFVSAFRGEFQLGALISFLVTISGIAPFNIGAAFWGLVFGFAASALLERKDFARAAERRREAAAQTATAD